MDAVNGDTVTVVDEDEVLTPRLTLAEIVKQCDHALTNRLAKRFATRDSLKSLRARASALIEQEDGRGWNEEFGKVVATADAVFDSLIAEVGTAGNA